MTPVRFFAIGGLVLIVSGVLQLLVRSRADRRFSSATLRSGLFILFGLLALLVGLGVIPLVRLG